MYASGKQIQLMAKLNPADSSLIADVDVGITNGRFYFLNDLQEEWISFTGVSASGSNFSYTGLTRGLSQTADPATAGTGLTWLAGNIGTLVQMHDQMPDKQTTNTWTGAQTMPEIIFSGTTTPGLETKRLTTAQINALNMSGIDSAIVYNTTEGAHWQYIGGAWTTFATGSTPNASTTAAGKVELATDAEITAGTATGGTGASLVLTPEQQKKSISLKGAGTTFGDTDEIAVNVSGTDLRITGANLRESIPASTTAKGTVELATDAETITGTDTTRYISPNSGRLALGKIIPGTEFIYLEANTERTTSSTSYVKLKEVTINEDGWYRFGFDLKFTSGAGGEVIGVIYKNGVSVGVAKSCSSTSYQSFTDDLYFQKGQLAQLYIRHTAGLTGYCRNFNVKYTMSSGVTAGIVNTD